jgi:hypothetical protein
MGELFSIHGFTVRAEEEWTVVSKECGIWGKLLM